MTVDTVRQARLAQMAVAKGVRILSEMDPHWYDKTDLGTFDMAMPSHDILGQLYGGYTVGMERIAKHLGKEWCVDLFGAEYGFNEGRAHEPTYKQLSDEWERVIRELVS